jgi:hypothetical protein
MEDHGFEQFVREFESGVAVPEVDPAHIKRMWDLANRLQAEARDRGVHFSSMPDQLRDALDTGMNLGAVWLRTGLLSGLVNSGNLKPWTPDSEFEQRLFGLVATFPVARPYFNPERFLEQLGEPKS